MGGVHRAVGLAGGELKFRRVPFGEASQHSVLSLCPTKCTAELGMGWRKAMIRNWIYGEFRIQKKGVLLSSLLYYTVLNFNTV